MLFKMEDVNLLYDEDKEEKTYALRGANLKLEQGKFYGILGPQEVVRVRYYIYLVELRAHHWENILQW